MSAHDYKVTIIQIPRIRMYSRTEGFRIGEKYYTCRDFALMTRMRERGNHRREYIEWKCIRSSSLPFVWCGTNTHPFVICTTFENDTAAA